MGAFDLPLALDALYEADAGVDERQQMCAVEQKPPGLRGSVRAGHEPRCRPSAEAGLPVIVGTDLESGLGALARAHLRAAIPSLEPWPSEMQVFEQLAGDVLTVSPAVVDGALAVPGGPGFGASIDEPKPERSRSRN